MINFNKIGPPPKKKNQNQNTKKQRNKEITEYFCLNLKYACEQVFLNNIWFIKDTKIANIFVICTSVAYPEYIAVNNISHQRAEHSINCIKAAWN